jgi:hypothetical protein
MEQAAAAFVVQLGGTFIPDIHNLAINAFDKIGFDMDKVGRQRMINEICRDARAEFGKLNLKYNIAVWNMHVSCEDDFEGIVTTGLKKMGNGGGFCVVVFTGRGKLTNNSHLGYDNWRCEGNLSRDGNVITFGEAE